MPMVERCYRYGIERNIYAHNLFLYFISMFFLIIRETEMPLRSRKFFALAFCTDNQGLFDFYNTNFG